MIALPKRTHLNPTEIADPLKFYYLPISRRFYVKRLEMVASLIRADRHERLLDIGCGSGIFLKELNTLCHHLTAIDLHRKMHLVQQMIQKEGIKADLCEGSVTHLPFASSAFDCVVSVSVLEHVRDLERAFSEIDRVSRKGAKIILGFPVKNVITDCVLKLSYQFLPEAKLEDEHVSSHIEILQRARKQFKIVRKYHFPSFVPLPISAYCILEILKK